MLKRYSYQIRVQSQLATDWSAWFDGMFIRQEGKLTILTGRLDQAALHGALTKIRDLGLPIISVCRQQAEEE